MNGDVKSQIQLFTILRGQSRELLRAKDEKSRLAGVSGLANNMLWIFGHLVRTTDFLILKLSGNQVRFPQGLDPYFAKGSSPATWQSVDGLSDQIFAAEEECQSGILDFLDSADLQRPHPEPYTTSTGFVLSNVTESLRYNVVHEGIHLGQLQLYSKMLP